MRYIISLCILLYCVLIQLSAQHSAQTTTIGDRKQNIENTTTHLMANSEGNKSNPPDRWLASLCGAVAELALVVIVAVIVICVVWKRLNRKGGSQFQRSEVSTVSNSNATESENLGISKTDTVHNDVRSNPDYETTSKCFSQHDYQPIRRHENLQRCSSVSDLKDVYSQNGDLSRGMTRPQNAKPALALATTAAYDDHLAYSYVPATTVAPVPPPVSDVTDCYDSSDDYSDYVGPDICVSCKTDDGYIDVF